MKRRLLAGLTGITLLAVPGAAHAADGGQRAPAETTVYQVSDIKDMPADPLRSF